MEEGWTLLPFDLFYRVASWCDAKSMVRASLVCRNWLDNSNSQHVWKVIYANYLSAEKKDETEEIDWHLLVKKKLVSIESNAEKLRCIIRTFSVREFSKSKRRGFSKASFSANEALLTYKENPGDRVGHELIDLITWQRKPMDAVMKNKAPVFLTKDFIVCSPIEDQVAGEQRNPFLAACTVVNRHNNRAVNLSIPLVSAGIHALLPSFGPSSNMIAFLGVQLILSFVEQMADMEPQRNRILYFDSQDIALSLRFFGNYIVTRFYDEIIVSNLRSGRFLQFMIPNCLAWSITDDHFIYVTADKWAVVDLISNKQCYQVQTTVFVQKHDSVRVLLDRELVVLVVGNVVSFYRAQDGRHLSSINVFSPVDELLFADHGRYVLVSDDCLRLVDIADIHLSKTFCVGVLGLGKETVTKETTLSDLIDMSANVIAADVSRSNHVSAKKMSKFRAKIMSRFVLVEEKRRLSLVYLSNDKYAKKKWLNRPATALLKSDHARDLNTQRSVMFVGFERHPVRPVKQCKPRMLTAHSSDVYGSAVLVYEEFKQGSWTPMDLTAEVLRLVEPALSPLNSSATM